MPIGKLAAFAINAAITAGGMALSYLLTPKAQPNYSDQGKLDDIRLTGSEYGTLIPRVWGNARLGSNLVWSSGIRHKIINYQTPGGKGAMPASATTTHVYTADLGLQICRGPITNFGRIWSDADVVSSTAENTGLVEAEVATLSGGAAVQISATASGGAYVKTLGTINFSDSALAFIKKPTNPEPLQTVAKSFVTIAYKSAAVCKLKVEIWDEDGVKVYDQVVDLLDTSSAWLLHQIVLTDAGGKFVSRVQVSKDGANTAPDIDRIGLDKFWDYGTTPSGVIYTPSSGFKDPYATFDNTSLNTAKFFNYHPAFSAQGVSVGEGIPAYRMHRYLGTTDQPANDVYITWLDSKYGTGNGVDFANAYRETAMVVFEDYNLRGGRIPNYTFEIFNDIHTLGNMLPTLLEECGLSATDYDLTPIDDIEFIGIVETARQSKKAFIENLGTYFGFRMYEADGKVKFVLDDDFTSVATLSSDILRARNEGDEQKPYDSELLCSPQAELPREMRFNIMNPALDYHNETIVAHVFTDIASVDSQELNFPVIDYPSTARLYCEQALLRNYAQTKSVRFTAMPDIMQYSLGDVVLVTLNDIEFKIRIEKMTIGMPIGVVEVEGLVIEEYDSAEIEVTVTQQATTTDFMSPKMLNLRNAKAIPIISWPIRGRDKGRLGCYIAVTPLGSGATDNIALYRELGNDNYVLIDALDVPAKAGVGDGTLGSHGNASTEDTTNTLDIYFYNTVSLESYTAAELSRYPTLNLIRIGDEWVQYRTATAQTLPSDSEYRSVWRISNLQRGRFGTSGEMSSHAADEDCVIWEDTMRFYDLNPEDVGETVTLKVTTGGQLVEDAKAYDFTFSPLSKYTVTNDTTDRAYDANSTSINELSDVVATIIDDLNL